MTQRRLHCVVPFCKRTRGQRRGEPPIADHEEWICGDHWRLVDRKMKRLKNRAYRRKRWAAGNRLWRICKRQAIERAAGIK